MSSMALTRPLARQSGSLGRTAARRFESSTATKAAETAREAATKTSSTASETYHKAAETAKEAAAKVSPLASKYAATAQQGLQQGLSKITSAAGPAAQGLATSLSKVGGRTGKVIAFAEKQLPHVIYYSKVALELGKIVFRGQKMSPPSVETFQSYWQKALKSIQSPSALIQTASQTASKVSGQPSSIIQQARNVDRAKLVAGGVVAAECLGFFTVGEMIGRFKIVGYHGGSGAAHH